MGSINYEKCGKYFGYIFWMLIPRLAASVLMNIRVPGVNIAGNALRIVCEFVSVYFLWQLRSEDSRFKTVSFFYIGVVICGAIQLVLGKGDVWGKPGLGLPAVFSLIGAVLSIFYIIKLYPLLSDILAGPSPELSKRWLLIRKLFIVGTIVTFASVFMILLPGLGSIAAVAGAVIMLIASIMDLIAMYRSSVACKNYYNIKSPRIE